MRVRAGSIQEVMAHQYRRRSALSAPATRVWLCARDVTPGVAAKREIVRERRRSKIPDLAINNKKATPDRMVPVATACRALQPRVSVDKRRSFIASQACMLSFPIRMSPAPIQDKNGLSCPSPFATPKCERDVKKTSRSHSCVVILRFCVVGCT